MIEANLRTAFNATNPPKSTAPDDIVHDAGMTLEAKRALLASWASDARAVPNCPALRRLDDGKVVLIDDVLDALKQLDGELDASATSDALAVPIRRGHWSTLTRLWRRGGDDDDDDPPTAPAAVAPRYPAPGGSLAAAA